uniref:DUF834 domain-containing protein n=1 Tax=Oryza barthii TaxID=65489 RepID=A0A0D3GYV4_9ORYZ
MATATPTISGEGSGLGELQRWQWLWQDQGGDQTRSKFTQASLRPARGGAAWEAWDQCEVARALGWLRPGSAWPRRGAGKEEKGRKKKDIKGKNIGIDNEKDGEK